MTVVYNYLRVGLLTDNFERQFRHPNLLTVSCPLMPYRVFLGAPSPQDLANIDSSAASAYHWQTVSSSSRLPSKSSSTRFIATQSFILPPATLEAASRRISLIYQNVIFDESKDEEGDSLLEEDHLRHGNEFRKLGGWLTDLPTRDWY